MTDNVVGAGDSVISQGQVTKVSNQSRTWHPRGTHLATALRAIVGWGVLDAALVKQGGREVQEFLLGTDDVDVDKGELFDSRPRHLQNL